MNPSDLVPAAHLTAASGDATSAPQDNQELDDVVLVNPGGRIVEVPGALAQDLLMENGYRKATAAEAKKHADYVKSVSPEVLRQQESKRVAAEKQEATDYLAAESKKSTPKAADLSAKTTAPTDQTKTDTKPQTQVAGNDSKPSDDAPADQPADSPKPRSRG